MRHATLAALTCCLTSFAFAQTSGSKPDPLGRDNPRSAVTGFLEAAHDRDYQRAAQYLDLRQVPDGVRFERGLELSRQLEAILNSDSHFNISQLSRNQDGAGSSGSERVTTVLRDGQSIPILLEKSLRPGSSGVWLFSAGTVAVIPELIPSDTPPWIAHFLPPFLVHQQLLETSLWKWAALILAVLLLLSLSRLLDRLFMAAVRIIGNHTHGSDRLHWLGIIVQPMRIMFCLAVFRVAVEFIAPSAIARLYIGRATEFVLVCSVAWCLVRLVDLFFTHLEAVLDARHDFSSRSMLHLGRRTANVTIIAFSILVVLSNWGYNTSTLIAGLGVGGIAVALAAQQTIANVFGGVSIIGDHPVGIGDFGKFGDLIGTVEDIGMRSTRIRTNNRTVVSVPNSSFAALNLENYSLRDKILFNPVIEVHRNAEEDEVRQLMQAIQRAVEKIDLVDLGPCPVRLIGLTAAAFRVEIFCYVRTPDINEFYEVQGELYLGIDSVLKQHKMQLA